MPSRDLRAVPDQDDEWGLLAEAARVYADRLGLRNHTVEMLYEPPSAPGALMECDLAFGRAHIRLRARGDFFDMPEDEQRLALTHELIHPHLQRLTDRTHRAFSENIGGVAFRIFWQGFEGDVEELVDRLAQLVAPSMPLLSEVRSSGSQGTV